MANKQLHQVVDSMLVGDATSDQVFLIRQWLRDLGFASNIYAVNMDDRLHGKVLPFRIKDIAEGSPVIYHHAIGSRTVNDLHARQVPLILVYHNITPPHFFNTADLSLTRAIYRGRSQLEEIRPQTRLALGDSPYSELELQGLGFSKTGVLPIALDVTQYALPIDKALYESCRAQGPLLLFVGRIAPNKRQEDLLKLLYYYRRIEPHARLVLVGSLQTEEYVSWLHDFARELSLDDAVSFTGHVTQTEMVTYYRASDLFVSMSEHEGFGKPLIESMYFELPVMAYASTAVPSTLGGAAVLFHAKEFEALAEMTDMIVSDKGLRRRIVAGQTARLQDFLEPTIERRLQQHLRDLDIL